MNVLLSTGSVSHLVPEMAFWLAQQADFDAVEVQIDKRMFAAGVDLLARYSAHHGVPIRNVHAPLRPIEKWGDYWGNLRESLAWARQVGARLLVIHPVPPGVWFGRRRQFSRRLEGLRDAAARDRITVALENLPRARRLVERRRRSLATYPAVVSLARERNVAITLDTTHLATWKADLVKSFAQADGRVANLHLSDYRPGQSHLLPTRGGLPLARLLKAARDAGYLGPITLETCPRALGNRPPDRILRLLKRSRIWIRAHAGR